MDPQNNSFLISIVHYWSTPEAEHTKRIERACARSTTFSAIFVCATCRKAVEEPVLGGGSFSHLHQVVEPFLAIHFQFEVHPTVSCNLVDITSLINFWLFMTNETHTDAMHLLGCCTVQFSDPRCRMHLTDTKFCRAPNAAAFISALL